jgi:hypothetical protein
MCLEIYKMGTCNSIMIVPYTESQIKDLSNLEHYSLIGDELVRVEPTSIPQRERLKLRRGMKSVSSIIVNNYQVDSSNVDNNLILNVNLQNLDKNNNQCLYVTRQYLNKRLIKNYDVKKRLSKPHKRNVLGQVSFLTFKDKIKTSKNNNLTIPLSDINSTLPNMNNYTNTD